jgi:hypothetical protein
MAAATFRASFPDQLKVVLDSRSTIPASACPADVISAMSKLSFFSAPISSASRFAGRLNTGASVEGGGGGNRFSHLHGSSTWRPTQSNNSAGGAGGAGGGGGDDDGFQTYTRRRGVGGGGNNNTNRHYGGGKPGSWGGGGHGKYWNGSHGGSKSSHHSAATSSTSAAPVVTSTVSAASASAPDTTSVSSDSSAIAFSSAAIKAHVATEERILAKVKGKINKIGPSTYEATKVFMQQILDSDETDFLDDFMKFVFQKAATESAFCPLYARLLHELADEFTHLRSVMCTLFHDYTKIFSEVEHVAPDPSSESYKEFVEAQERKKFRRGYSQFVAELVKQGEVDLEAFRTLIFLIVSVIDGSHSDAGKTQLSEEYIDCLSNMCRSASPILIVNSWSADLLDRLAAFVSKPASSLPGFTPKARFALMNLVDYGRRGWK